MITVFYTGDKRHNATIANENHARLLTALRLLCPVAVFDFTKDFPGRGDCPFDEGGPDTSLRRGEGGAVQVWDFMTSCDRVATPVVLKLRTDVWFGPGCIDVIIQHAQDVLQNRLDVVFLGSDLVNDNFDKEHEIIPITRHDPARIQDFVVIAKREALLPTHAVIEQLTNIGSNKRRSGNKTFRSIIKDNVNAVTVLCNLWLIRKYYNITPEDWLVYYDFVQSYIGRNQQHVDVLAPAIDYANKKLKECLNQNL
jgi:hypothetical protein